MAQERISAPPAIGAGAGSRVTRSVEPGQALRFDFSFDDVTVAREGTSLSIEFEDGRSLLLEDFFVAGEANALPDLTLADGSVVSAADFLLGMNRDLDVSLAAGPQAAATGSGSGDYADDGGALLAGVDKMGMRDSFGAGWNTAREGLAHPDSLAGTPGPGADAATGGPGGGAGGGAEGLSYSARAVLYVGDEDYAGGYTVLAQALYPDASGRPVPVSGGAGRQVTVEPAGGWNQDWGVWAYDPATGRIAVSLTEAGHAALLAPEAGNLIEYFTVSVTDPEGGPSYAYTMQVVVTAGRDFSSPGQNALPGDVALAGEEVLYGEWHNAYGGTNADGAYRIVSSTGHDEIIIRDVFQNGSAIYASRQGNAEYDPADPSTFTGGGDANTIKLLGGMRAEGGAANLVDSSGGAILAEQRSLDGDAAALRADAGSNRIDGHAGALSARAVAADGSAYALRATAGGTNRISADGATDVAAYGSKDAYALHADAAGENIIQGGPGTVTVTAGNLDEAAKDANGNFLPVTTGQAVAMYAYGGGNSISATGAVGIAASGAGRVYGMYAGNSANNTIADAASVTVSLTGNGNNYMYGMYAFNASENSISTNGPALLSVSGGYESTGMHMGWGGTNSITQTEGAPGGPFSDVTIATGGRYKATGMAATGGNGQNIVNALGDVDLSAHAGWVAYGMHSTSGANVVNSRSGSVTVTAGNLDKAATDADGNSIPVSTSTTAAMYAKYGTNHISASGEVSISAASTLENWLTGAADTGHSASGMFATFKGTNSIGAPLGEDGPLPSKVTVNAQVTTDTPKNVSATGMHAYAGGDNSIDSGGGVHIHTDITRLNAGYYIDEAYGMLARYSSSMATYMNYGATNTITAKGDVTVEVTTSHRGTINAYGICTESPYSSLTNTTPDPSKALVANTITADGDVTVAVLAQGNGAGSGSVTGIRTYAYHSQPLDVRTTIDSGGEVWVVASASGFLASSARAVTSGGHRVETIINAAKDAHLLATVEGGQTGSSNGSGSSAHALAAAGTTITSTEGDITLTAAASGFARLETMYAGNGENKLTALNGQVSIQAYGQGDGYFSGSSFTTKGTVTGLRAYAGGTNTITAEGVTITAGNLTEQVITGKNGEHILTAGPTLADAYGVWQSGSANTISAGAGGVTIAAATTLGTARGLHAQSNVGPNTVTTTGAVAINADGGKAAYGATTVGSAQNIIANAASVTITAKAAAALGEACAIGQTYGADGGGNVITASGDVTLAAAALGKAYGMLNDGFGGNSVTAGGAVDMTVEGDAEAYGMSASSGFNSIKASSATVTAGAGDGAAYAMSGTGANSIDASGAVTLAATGQTGAFGMHAVGYGDHSITGASLVRVAANAAQGPAYAMYAQGETLVASIQPANSIDLSGSDRPVTVVLTAASGSNAARAFAMYAEHNGINSIATGAGDDSVMLTGAIHAGAGGRNSIHTGAGDDTITLDGAVEITAGGSFIINGGDGYDLLVLKAANAGEFAERYGSWLQTLSPGDLSGIEAVRFVNVTPQDVEQGGSLQAVYDSLANAGISVIVGEPLDAALILDHGNDPEAWASYAGVFDDAHALGGDTVSFGDGADQLTFGNGLSGGGVDMGAGNDMVDLAGGRVENTGINMGAGNDHLSLGNGVHLHHAAVDMGAGNDHVYLGAGLSMGENVSITGGDGTDTLHLGGGGEHITLSGLAGLVEGFEVLSLAGGGNNTLAVTDADLNAMLHAVSQDGRLTAGLITAKEGGISGNLEDMSVIRITGDPGDAVQLDGNSGYARTGAVTYDGVAYTVYQAEASEEAALLIQNELLGMG